MSNSLENYKIIDLHTHILNNVDDGANSIQETISLLQEALEMGISNIILTPHYYEGLFTVNKNIITKNYNDILKIVKEKCININIYLGNEIYISPNINEKILLNEVLILNNTKYVLVETSFEIEQLYLKYELKKIIENGFIPILAHVERYQFIQKNIKKVDEFIELGVEIQCNYGSVIGLYGENAKKIIKKLLKQNKVDYMASDVHKQSTIYKYMPKVLKELRRMVSQDYLEKIIYLNANKLIR